AVQRVAAHESGVGGRRLVSVVLSLARPSTYSVRTEGRDVVVRVTAREPAPAVVARADAGRAQSAEAAARAARAEAARARDEARRAKVGAREAPDEARRDMQEAREHKRQEMEVAETPRPELGA